MWLQIYLEVISYPRILLQEIEKMVADPMNHNEQLRHLCRMIYNSNGIVTNVIDYMKAMPTLDKIVISW